MNAILRIGAMVTALTFAAPATAQEQQQHSGGRVGIGLGLPIAQDSLFGISSAFGAAPQIFVPINIGPNLRIEPQLGYLSISNDENDTTDRSFTLGAGLFFVKPATQQTQLYLGGRLAVSWNRDEQPTFKDEWTNLSLAGVLGGEYLPAPWFSVGAEAQLQYTNLGDIDHTPVGAPTVTEQGGSVFSTGGLLFLRVYFL